MKKKFSILLCVMLLALSGCRISGNTIRFGAADIGGMYYSFANTFTYRNDFMYNRIFK